VRYVQGLIPQFLTPDRRRLAFTSVGAGTGFDIFTVPVESDGAGLRAGKPEVFRKRRLTDAPLLFARRGWIAYDSNESGRTQIYVRAFPDKGGKWQVTNEGGIEPVWSHTRELFFHAEANRIMVAEHSVKGDRLFQRSPTSGPKNGPSTSALLCRLELSRFAAELSPWHSA